MEWNLEWDQITLDERTSDIRWDHLQTVIKKIVSSNEYFKCNDWIQNDEHDNDDND